MLRGAFQRHRGAEVDTQGDAFFFAFPSAPEALQAARDGLEGLRPGPIQVRIGLHTGMPLVGEEGYVGEDVHFAARVAASGHGGQILLSKETRALVADGFLVSSLGSHRLKDVSEPVTIYQLGEQSFPRLKTVANSNLPTPASSFLGREAELYEADELLQEARLLTVTGPGGAGKTRFSLELAHRAREERFRDYEDGVFCSFLSALRDPSLVLVTICSSLDVREQAGQSSLQALTSHLQGKSLLLMLDNLEHLPEAFRELSELVSACPGLTLLCASRERMRLQGERVYELPPLTDTESVSLFCERSQTEPTDAARELCVRLEGLPLAIELAAARTSVLTPEQITNRLSQRLDLLKGGPDRDPRQETLRATIEWSYDLLTSDEQQLFARLSVFAGGCTLEAAEEVAGADLDTLQSLVDKSLLRFTKARYWLLETIREFAIERLVERGDQTALQQRHLCHLREWVEQVNPQLKGAEQLECLDRLEADHDNFRAALEHGLRGLGDPVEAGRLAAALLEFWDMRSHYEEARRWFADVFDRRDQIETGMVAEALRGAGLAAYRQGNEGEAVELYLEALTAYEAAMDLRGQSRVLGSLVFAAFGIVDVDQVVSWAERSVALATASKDVWTQGCAFAALASVTADVGDDPEEAWALYEQALGLFSDIGDLRNEAIIQLNLGVVAVERGAYDQAGALLEGATANARIVGDTGTVAAALMEHAGADLQEGRDHEAGRRLQEALEPAVRLSQSSILMRCLVGTAVFGCRHGEVELAARILGPVDASLSGSDAWIDHDPWSEKLLEVRSCVSRNRLERAVEESRTRSLVEAAADALELLERFSLEDGIGYA